VEVLDLFLSSCSRKGESMATATAKLATERRVAPRRQPTLGTVCYLHSSAGDDLGVGLVWNISTSGVSMLLHQRLENGTTLSVELTTASETYTLPVTLRVAHITQLRTGDYVMGGQFLRPLTADDIRPFVG
jgi:hypothetical protein